MSLQVCRVKTYCGFEQQKPIHTDFNKNIRKGGRNVFELESLGHRGHQTELDPGTERIWCLISLCMASFSSELCQIIVS